MHTNIYVVHIHMRQHIQFFHTEWYIRRHIHTLQHVREYPANVHTHIPKEEKLTREEEKLKQSQANEMTLVDIVGELEDEVYTFTRTYTHTHTHTHTYAHTCTHIRISEYAHTHVHMHIHTHTCTH